MTKLWHPSWQDPQGSHLVNEDRWFDHNQSILLQIANTDYGRDMLNISKNGLPVVYIAKNEVRYLLGMKDGLYECMSHFAVGAKWGNEVRVKFSQFRSLAKYFEVQGWDQAGKTMFSTDDARVLALTLTAYPDANVETTTFDGYVGFNSPVSYATAHDSASGNTNNDSATEWDLENGDEGVGSFYEKRGITLYDTLSLTASASISAATLSLYGHSMLANASSDSVSIVSATTASNTAIGNNDYGGFGTTKFATDITFASWSTAGYNDFALNASGISNISKTGVSKFGIRTAKDVSSTAPGTSEGNYVQAKSADTASTTSDPKLVVTYTVASFVPRIIIT
jgi:hypothetical protein